MALNPPLLPGNLPMGIVGERFCVELELDSPGLTKIKASGQLFLTTVRICFVPEKPTATFSALDIPLQGLSEEDFCQPIFGANYLKGIVAPVPGRGLLAPSKFKLHFYHGGCQTFLKFFFEIMEKYKQVDTSRSTFFQSPPAVQNFIQDMQAYMDPSDPTKIFIAQPAAIASAVQLPASSVPYAPPAPRTTYGFAPVPVGGDPTNPLPSAPSSSVRPIGTSYEIPPGTAFAGYGSAPTGLAPSYTAVPPEHAYAPAPTGYGHPPASFSAGTYAAAPESPPSTGYAVPSTYG